MSKKFEEEYRQMIDSELPDLWDRIEAQLPKTDTAAVIEETAGKERTSIAAAMEEDAGKEQMSPAAEAERYEDSVNPGRRKRFQRRWMPVAIAGAAAVLCIVAALPVLLQSRDSKSESLTNAATQENGFSGGYADMTADAGGTDGCSADVECESAGMEPLPAEYPFGDVNADTAEETMTEDAMEQNADYAPMDSALQDAEEESTDSVSQGVEEKPAMAEELAATQVEVEILDCISSEDGEVFYEAAVLREGENVPKKDVRVYFRAAGDGEEQIGRADVSFLPGEKYVLSIYQSGETLESYGIETGKEDLYGTEMYIVYEVVAKYFKS